MNANWLNGNIGVHLRSSKPLIAEEATSCVCATSSLPYFSMYYWLFFILCDLCYRNPPLPPLLQKRQTPQRVFLDVSEMLLTTLLLSICFHRKSRLSCSSCIKLGFTRLDFHFRLWPVPPVAIHKWPSLLTPLLPPWDKGGLVCLTYALLFQTGALSCCGLTRVTKVGLVYLCQQSSFTSASFWWNFTSSVCIFAGSSIWT